MYDMYPEWGPSQTSSGRAGTDRTSTDRDHAGPQAVQVGLDLRDHGGQRPDDN